MRPPSIDVRIFLDVPDEGWAYVVKQSGEIIAASDGDDHYLHIGEALKAALAEANEAMKRKNGTAS